MHFPIGLLAILVAVVVSTRRTRPRWWLVVVGVLLVAGVAWSVLGLTGVTVSLGGIVVATVGWVYLGLCIATLLSAVLVLERRGPRGQQAPPILGDNPLDGDPDDRGEAARAPRLP